MASKNVLTATDENFGTEVLKASTPVLVDFWAEWCGPCKALGPTIDELAEEFQGKAKVFKMNVDEHPEIPGQLGIRSIPTLIVFKNGEAVDHLIGAHPKNTIASLITKNL
jgi:thioredoxin 1